MAQSLSEKIFMSNLKRFVKLSDLTLRSAQVLHSVKRLKKSSQATPTLLQIKDIRSIATDTCGYTLFADALPQIGWHGKDNAIVSPETLLPCHGEYLKAHYFVGYQDQSKAHH